MTVPIWAFEIAQSFWIRARESELFPRNLRRAISRAVPVSIALLPTLSVRAALEWMRKIGIVCEIPGTDRPLRACLVVRRGHGLVLVDGSDEDAEQTFSIAHELAHFLRDYLHIWKQIKKRIGAAAVEVLDGEREPTAQERAIATLRNVPLAFHLHLMERNCDGNPARASILAAERDADRLAYELLAPAEQVLAACPGANRHDLTRSLQHVYGLPQVQSGHYAALLVPVERIDPLIRRLRTVV